MTPTPLSDEQILAEMRRQIYRAYVVGLGASPWVWWWRGFDTALAMAVVGILIGGCVRGWAW